MNKLNGKGAVCKPGLKILKFHKKNGFFTLWQSRGGNFCQAIWWRISSHPIRLVITFKKKDEK